MPEGHSSEPGDPRGDDDRFGGSPRGLRLAVVVAAGLRYLIPIAALPFVAVLVPDHVLLLVLLRPGKEVMLLGGGLWRTSGSPSLVGMLLAYLPLMVGGVWAFFLLGRLYAGELRAGRGPTWLQRIVPTDTLSLGQRILERHGPAIAVVGRVAALPPTILAAAAGTSEVRAGRYLAADLIGALLAFAVTVGLGAALGDAYERGGWWLTGGGLVVVALLFALVTRWVRTEAARAPGAEDA